MSSSGCGILESESQFTPISVFTLYPPAQITADLYLPAMNGSRPRLYTAAIRPPLPAELDRLVAAGIRQLLIPTAELETFREQLRELLIDEPDLPPLLRIEMAREGAKAAFAEAWRRLESDPLIQQASNIAEQVLEACEQEEELKGQLLSLVMHDGDTFAHVTNVCTFAVVLGTSLGIRLRELLLEIGTAALLHDLGKRHINNNVLRKPGPLTLRERQLMSEHPRMGFEELCRRTDLTQGQLLMVYQHHEKLDGTGYPVRLNGDEIHWMARLCAVVDVFDALTARRAYRKPATAEEALQYLEQESGKHFDPEMAECWRTIMAEAISTST